MKHVCIAIIRLYQWTLSGLLGPCCRFHPSCSCYAVEALRRHGALKGLWLTLCRIGKCHPFHPGGYDPVPERRDRPCGCTAHRQHSEEPLESF